MPTRAVGELQNSVLQRFRQEHLGIGVDYIPSIPDFNAEIQSMLATGTLPNVIWAQGPLAAGYASKGQFGDFDPLIRRDRFDLSDFYKPSMRVFVYQGKPIALPRDLGAAAHLPQRVALPTRRREAAAW
jgi:ABC-type glycerol-3-phosphate transport system substrate-binding protein